MTFKDKVIRRLAKPLKFRADRIICQNLQHAGMDALDAYKLGAEEAQGLMIERVQQMLDPGK